MDIKKILGVVGLLVIGFMVFGLLTTGFIVTVPPPGRAVECTHDRFFGQCVDSYLKGEQEINFGLNEFDVRTSGTAYFSLYSGNGSLLTEVTARGNDSGEIMAPVLTAKYWNDTIAHKIYYKNITACGANEILKTVGGFWTCAPETSSQNIIPASNLTYNIGNSTNYYSNIFVKALYWVEKVMDIMTTVNSTFLNNTAGIETTDLTSTGHAGMNTLNVSNDANLKNITMEQVKDLDSNTYFYIDDTGALIVHLES